MPTTINGWEFMSSYGDARLRSAVVPGTKVRIKMHKTVLPLFLALAADYNREVAKLRPLETGAFNPRRSRLSPTKYSDHGSGTAIDINWNHEGAMGAKGGMKTMTPKQIAACAAIKKRYKIVIWGGDKARGGDYVHAEYWDPMHFAIKPGVTPAQVLKTISDLGIDKNGVRAGSGDKKPSIVARVTAVANHTASPAPVKPAVKKVAKKVVKPVKKAVPAAPAKKAVKKVAPKKAAS